MSSSPIDSRMSKFGAAGKWNSTNCQTEYTLTSNSSRGSLAEIRGGIDGFIIGQKAKEVADSGARFKLSQLLRMYYSPKGLFDDQTSVCRRDMASSQLNQIKEQVKNYMSAYAQLVLKVPTDENRVSFFVDNAGSDWDNAVRLATQTVAADRDWCDSGRDAGSSNINARDASCEACIVHCTTLTFIHL